MKLASNKAFKLIINIIFCNWLKKKKKFADMAQTHQASIMDLLVP